MRLPRRFLATVLGVALVSAGCTGSSEKTEVPEATAVAAGGAMSSAGSTPPPDDGTPDVPKVQGVPVAVFFQASCATCHGANRAGISGLGLPLLPEVLTKEDAFYFDTIKNGRAGTVMPAWGQQGLTDEDIHTLVEFIKNTPP